jgi:hypothetical protein
MLVGHYPLSLFKGLTFKDAAKGFLAGIGRRLLGRVAVHCALDRNGIGVPINLPLIWIGRPIAVAHFDVTVGGVIGHDRNMRPNPKGRYSSLIQTGPLPEIEVPGQGRLGAVCSWAASSAIICTRTRSPPRCLEPPDAVEEVMIDLAEKRGQLIKCLEDALTLAEQLDDGTTEYLIERALDEARSRQFKPATDRH